MNLRKFKYNFTSYLQKRFGKSPKGVAMFHFGRCGSTAIGEVLAQHSQVTWDNELFQKIKDSPERVLDTRFISNPFKILENRMYRTKTRIYGFETKTHDWAHFNKDFLNLKLDAFLDEIAQVKFEYYIILKRKNFLKQVLSVNRGIQHGRFHYRKEDVVISNQVHLDPKKSVYGNQEKDIIEIFESFNKHYELLERELKRRNIKPLIIIYEDDIENNIQTGYKKICDFLSIEKENLEAKVKKIGKKKLKNEISNYTELENHLEKTEYTWMLK